MTENKTSLVCQCVERGLLGGNPAEPADALFVSDLCRAAQDNDPVFKEISEAEHPVIFACHPRAVKSLFVFAGWPLPDSTEFVNLRNPTNQPSATPTLPSSSSPAWFPVIDYDRCIHCGQCFQFCLFGVYEKDAQGRVVVAKPDSCKNNCPACARICPEAAIIFPKTGEEPINGADVSDEAELKANIKVNIDEILGDDVYAALNARKQKRRSLFNKKKLEQALAERKKCSEKET